MNFRSQVEGERFTKPGERSLTGLAAYRDALGKIFSSVASLPLLPVCRRMSEAGMKLWDERFLQNVEVPTFPAASL